MGRVLRDNGYRLLEALQGFADGVGHGDVDVIARVILFDGKPAVLAARWVDSDVVIIPEGLDKVSGIVYGKELILKSSTARVKVVGRVEWVQRPEVCATGAQLWGWRLRKRRL